MLCDNQVLIVFGFSVIVYGTCIVSSSTVYGAITSTASVKMELGLKTFPVISVMILVSMETFSTAPIGNEFLDGMLRVFPDMSRGVSDGILLTVGGGWNRGLPSTI